MIMKVEGDGEGEEVGHGSRPSSGRRIKLKERKSRWKATSWYLFVCLYISVSFLLDDGEIYSESFAGS